MGDVRTDASESAATTQTPAAPTAKSMSYEDVDLSFLDNPESNPEVDTAKESQPETTEETTEPDEDNPGEPTEESNDDESEEAADGNVEFHDVEIEGETYQIPVKLKSHIDKLAKGSLRQSDYTKKTQELAEERKRLEKELETSTKTREEVENIKKTYATELTASEMWSSYLEELKESDPTTYDDVVSGFKRYGRAYSNPAVNKIKAELDELKKMTYEKVKASEIEDVRKTYEKELLETKSKYDDKLKALGLKVDWDSKVKKAYINGAETVESALLASYGADILKLKESKGKVDNAKKIVVKSKKISTAGKSSSSGQTDVRPAFKGGNYEDLMQQMLRAY